MDNFFEFHCHSRYSSDSNLSLESIIETCQKSRITGICLTDHNEIAGALKLKKIAPDWLRVLIGEEIETAQGEIIGIFLNKKIYPGLTPEETITQIKEQNGLVVLPHPFDQLRSKKLSSQAIEKCLDYFDLVETFNARCVFSSDNEKAKKFAQAKNKASICGSDAHFRGEYGKTVLTGINCQDPKQFLESLKKTSVITRKAPLFFHLLTKYQKLIRR